ncbi:MAG TPA: glycosyltransferase [Nitrososphaeraceae archaeon]|nr:glycosyltransferase [Nitrososphaeraceae archaeon]
MKRAKIVHDNLNAGGGSERLAFATLELLNEMGFAVDLTTLQNPNLEAAEKDFGNDASHLWKFNQIEIVDMYSLLNLENIESMNKKDNINNERNGINNIPNKSGLNDEDYDLIINTHGDLLPYYNGNNNKGEYSNKDYIIEKSNTNKINIKSISYPIKLTYCHYPLVPLYINRKDYSFLEKFFDSSFNEFPQKIQEMIAFKTLEKYNQMMNNTFILTNSNFSKQAIEKTYRNNKIKVTIIYPPVDIDRFKKLYNDNKEIIDNNQLQKDHNSILVISRISPNKKIENAIEIGKKLKETENINYYNMTIVGNIVQYDRNYLAKLNNLIAKYDLKDYIKIKTDVPFDELQKLLGKSNIYLHPTPAEPFGISIVEAMSAGLVPITSNVGGNIEFVPSKYQYNSIDHAAELISKIIKNKTNTNVVVEKQNISNFSKAKYKENLKKIFESSLKEKLIEVTIK